MHSKKARVIKNIFSISSVLVLIASIVLAILWIFIPHTDFNFEPALGLLGLLYAAIPIFGTFVIKKLDKNLKQEKLTLPYALAYGYLNNYLSPVVKGLRAISETPNDIEFYVYIPRSLEELYEKGINTILNELNSNKYSVEKVELKFDDLKRGKDYRIAKRQINTDIELKYFDFPTTLLTLEPAVDYKLSSESNSFNNSEKSKLAQELIQEFSSILKTLLESPIHESIRGNIILTEKYLLF